MHIVSSEYETPKRARVSKTAVHQAVSKFSISKKYTDQKRSGRPRKTRAYVYHATRKMVIRSLTAYCEKIKHTLTQRDTIFSRSAVSRS